MREVAGTLRAAGIDAADAEARWIVEAAAGLSRAELLHDEPDEAAMRQARALAARRAGGEPLQYVTGVAGFRRIEIAVGPGVMVPRPETEVVAGRAIERLVPGGTAVDVCTGSGAIALSIADERPDARVIATELSPHAMSWARRNATALSAPVELVACDLLHGLPAEVGGSVDVVVSNPPYVATAEQDLLPKDVVDHEPAEALFAGDDGLALIARLVAEASSWLTPGGWLVFEIGERQGEAVRSLLLDAGYEDVSILPDLTGRDRVAEGRWA